jgi:hypothetical protein
MATPVDKFEGGRPPLAVSAASFRRPVARVVGGFLRARPSRSGQPLLRSDSHARPAASAVAPPKREVRRLATALAVDTKHPVEGALCQSSGDEGVNALLRPVLLSGARSGADGWADAGSLGGGVVGCDRGVRASHCRAGSGGISRGRKRNWVACVSECGVCANLSASLSNGSVTLGSGPAATDVGGAGACSGRIGGSARGGCAERRGTASGRAGSASGSSLDGSPRGSVSPAAGG